MAKRGQKIAVFWPWRVEFWPFFKIFCKSLLNKPKNIILKNRKNPLSKKVFKSKKLQKWPKKGKKWPFFGPGGPNFAKIKKRLGHSLTFTPERLYTKFQKIWLIRLGENALQTNERTDGTEIIGPSGKIPGTNNWRQNNNSIDWIKINNWRQIYYILIGVKFTVNKSLNYNQMKLYLRFKCD